MKRRDFITLLGGAAAAWPLAARGQQAAVPVIGFLNSGAPEAFVDRVAGFHRGLKEAGFIERQNVTIEYAWARGQLAELPKLAADLVRLPVSVIAATGNTPSALAARQETSTIPIVFISGSDPVEIGLVASMNRPGGNATGVSSINNDLSAKRLQILRDLVPGATRIAFLTNSTNPATQQEALALQKIVAGVGLQVVVVRAAIGSELETAFATLVQQGAGALIVTADPFFNNERDQIVALAARHRIPAIYSDRVNATAGGLLSYGPSLVQLYSQVGAYTGLILKGAKPADLPVVQPTKFELIINLKTARTLGLTIPPGVLAIADEVIE
jgi:putative ABC transport system substrate-binding protein